MIRDQMKKGDRALFYHSNCEVPGVVGTEMTLLQKGNRLSITPVRQLERKTIMALV